MLHRTFVIRGRGLPILAVLGSPVSGISDSRKLGFRFEVFSETKTAVPRSYGPGFLEGCLHLYRLARRP